MEDREGRFNMPVAQEMSDKLPHKHEYVFVDDCSSNVCMDCNSHQGLERCYCGWASSGGDGYKELLDLGEHPDAGEFYGF